MTGVRKWFIYKILVILSLFFAIFTYKTIHRENSMIHIQVETPGLLRTNITTDTLDN